MADEQLTQETTNAAPSNGAPEVAEPTVVDSLIAALAEDTGAPRNRFLADNESLQTTLIALREEKEELARNLATAQEQNRQLEAQLLEYRQYFGTWAQKMRQIRQNLRDKHGLEFDDTSSPALAQS